MALTHGVCLYIILRMFFNPEKYSKKQWRLENLN